MLISTNEWQKGCVVAYHSKKKKKLKKQPMGEEQGDQKMRKNCQFF